MNKEIKIDIPSSFSPQSRIWIYQCSRPLTDHESLVAESMLQSFTSQWSSHGKKVIGTGLFLYKHFLILIADESSFEVSGCSTDSSVRLIKEIEKKLNISLFDRQTLAFFIDDEIIMMPLAQFRTSVEEGILQPDTLYFNNVITRLEELKQNWLIPVQRSWLATKMNLANTNH